MRIGVLIPTHKRHDVIGRALASLEKQTVKPHSVIVIGNGMSDEEAAKYNVYGVSAFLNYPHFANIAQALQFGLAHLPTDTEFVSVLEDDDEWKPEFLERMSNELATRHVAMVYCDEIEIDPHGIEVDWTGHPEFYSRKALLAGNWIHFPVQMWRYDALVSGGGFSSETNGAADWDIALRISKFGVYHLREKLCIHHWLSSRDDLSPKNNCLSPQKMSASNQWIAYRKQIGVYS